jgi:hypothetical protein
MTIKATATFKIQGWDESPYTEIDSSRKLTRASVKQAFSGDIEGEGAVEWLMCYRPDDTADFVGLQRIVGRLGDRSGSFVMLQSDGTFDGKEARGKLTVVPGSGTEELSDLRGEGTFSAPREGEPSVTLAYELD